MRKQDAPWGCIYQLFRHKTRQLACPGSSSSSNALLWALSAVGVLLGVHLTSKNSAYSARHAVPDAPRPQTAIWEALAVAGLGK